MTRSRDLFHVVDTVNGCSWGEGETEDKAWADARDYLADNAENDDEIETIIGRCIIEPPAAGEGSRLTPAQQERVARALKAEYGETLGVRLDAARIEVALGRWDDHPAAGIA